MSTGYGYTMWCTDQIRSGRRASGIRAAQQAQFRRLTTARGTLQGGEEEAAYGFDVAGYVGAVGTDIALRALPSQVQNELLKDDRVATVVVLATISTTPAGEVSIVLDITSTLADSGEEFSLTLQVTAVTVTILGGVT